MAWCQTGDILLYETMMALITDAYMLHSPLGVLKFQLRYKGTRYHQANIMFVEINPKIDKHGMK